MKAIQPWVDVPTPGEENDEYRMFVASLSHGILANSKTNTTPPEFIVDDEMKRLLYNQGYTVLKELTCDRVQRNNQVWASMAQESDTTSGQMSKRFLGWQTQRQENMLEPLPTVEANTYPLSM